MNREAWLTAAVADLRYGLFAAADLTVPPVAVACGFGRSGAEAAGETEFNTADGVPQIYVAPVLSEPVEVLVLLVHELVHATLGVDGHGKTDHSGPFKRTARLLGLRPPWDSHYGTTALLLHLAARATVLGPYPHARLL